MSRKETGNFTAGELFWASDLRSEATIRDAFNAYQNEMIGRKREAKMKIYIATKIVGGEPMTAREFETHTGRTIVSGIVAPSNDQPGYKVTYEDGYVSWSPAEIFERTHREVSTHESRLINNAEYLNEPKQG